MDSVTEALMVLASQTATPERREWAQRVVDDLEQVVAARIAEIATAKAQRPAPSARDLLVTERQARLLVERPELGPVVALAEARRQVEAEAPKEAEASASVASATRKT